MLNFLDFEKPIAELEGKINELKHLSQGDGVNIIEEIKKLQEKSDRLIRKIYGDLSPWQVAQIARHLNRPHTVDYIKALIEDFTPLAGDRLYGEDKAIVGGLGRFRGTSVVVLGQEKGRETNDKVTHNFGMPKPEGYRKAQRLMKLADKFSLPLLTFVDTSGADPGKESEERGQAEAIASSMQVSLGLGVPVISTIIGEGGSGGAIAIATANRILMLEYAVYSVISPEGCASILWRDAEKKQEAAAALKMQAKDLIELGVIDEIVPEPLGGAHRNYTEMFTHLGEAINRNLARFANKTPEYLRQQRRDKFLSIGNQFLTD